MATVPQIWADRIQPKGKRHAFDEQTSKHGYNMWTTQRKYKIKQETTAFVQKCIKRHRNKGINELDTDCGEITTRPITKAKHSTTFRLGASFPVGGNLPAEVFYQIKTQETQDFILNSTAIGPLVYFCNPFNLTQSIDNPNPHSQNRKRIRFKSRYPGLNIEIENLNNTHLCS